MKISCLQENLAKGLSVVGRAVAVRSTLPQASHVLLASEEGRLKLLATNLEIAISCWIGAQVEDEGAITVPARLLADFVTSLPAERIDMTVAPRARQLHISCARNEATIAGMDAADFPPVPSVADGLSARSPGAFPFRHLQEYLDEIVLIEERDIADAFRTLLFRGKVLAEPAGVVASAGFLSGKVEAGRKTVACVTGGNVTEAVVRHLLDVTREDTPRK